MLKKIVSVFLVLLVVLFIGGLIFVWQVGAWNIVFPSAQHDVEAPEIPADLSSGVLVFSKTNSFRHKDGIAGGRVAFNEIADQLELDVFATENGAIFNTQDLKRFDVVVFLNATGDMLSESQEAAFQTWLETGGGWLGVHAAGDGSHAGWPWYVDNLLGAEFTAHILGPQFQTATVVTENAQHPINHAALPNWEAEEEWYSWQSSPRTRGFEIIATIDERTYSPLQNLLGNSTDLSMGDHPVAWTNCVGAGRSFYTALGHKGVAFEHPQFRNQLANALRWLQDEAPCSS